MVEPLYCLGRREKNNNKPDIFDVLMPIRYEFSESYFKLTASSEVKWSKWLGGKHWYTSYEHVPTLSWYPLKMAAIISGIARTKQEMIWIFMNLCYCGRKYAGRRHGGGLITRTWFRLFLPSGADLFGGSTNSLGLNDYLIILMPTSFHWCCQVSADYRTSDILKQSFGLNWNILFLLKISLRNKSWFSVKMK